MKRIDDDAIVLVRRNFAEADKIVVFATRNHGKITGIVKGARKQKSKLAGGIELFSVSQLTYLESHRDIQTVVSTRLETYYDKIVTSIDRTMAGYEVLKTLHIQTEHAMDSAYFDLLQKTFEGLNDMQIDIQLVLAWFNMQLLELSGHSLQLERDENNQLLKSNKSYTFLFETMGLAEQKDGIIDASTIKLLRLLQTKSLQSLNKLQNISLISEKCAQLSKKIIDYQKA